MLERNFIGHKFDSYSVEVEKGSLRFFAKAIGETNPIYVHEEAARAAGYPTLPAPPTYGIALEGLNPNPWPWMKLLGLENKTPLPFHGEQEFEYFRLIYAGDRLTLQERIVDMFDKKDGRLEFLVTETTVTNERGELVMKSRETHIRVHAGRE